MSVAKFLTDNKENMQENMEIVFEILEDRENIIESYCDAIIKKHKANIENKDFEIFINKKWRLDMDYNLIIRPKERNKVYIAFCVRKYSGKLYHSIELFYPYNKVEHNDSAKYKDYNKEIILKMKEQGMNLDWFNLSWTYSFSTFEKELQRFLDNKEQKKWNKQIEKALQNGLSELIQGADKD